jgi:flagellar protein FliS
MARDIIVEFNNALDTEAGGEIAKNLRSLYFFMNRQLMEASWNNDIQGLNEVIQLLSKLREGWQTIYDQKASLDCEFNEQSSGLRI